MKRILAVFLLAAILIVPAAAASDFTDVPENHWAYEYIRNAVDGGLVNGVGDGRFEPEGKVTGFEFAAMVERAVYQDELRDAQADEAWYQPYVDIAKSHGLLTNGLDNLAVLSQPISRYQMAVILFNILDEAGVVTRENGEVIGDAGKVIILLGDAAPLDPEPYTGYIYEDVLLALFNADISLDYENSDQRVVSALDTSLINVYTIGTSASSDAEDFFRSISSAMPNVT